MTNNKAEIVKCFIDVIWNQGKSETVHEFISSQYKIYHDPGDPFEGKKLNHEMFIERLKKSRDILNNLEFNCIDFYELKNKVVLTWKFSAKYSPTNIFLENIHGITIYYFENNKISGHWQEFDRFGMIEKIKESQNS